MNDPLTDPASCHYQLLEIMLGSGPIGPTVFRRAAELGIFPTVRAWLERRGDDVSISDPGARRDAIARSLRMRAMLELLDVVDVPVVVLKGAPLGRELYGDPAVRQSGDIDLLVARDNLDTACDALHELGYQPVGGVDPDANREIEMVHRQTGLLVDLHWRIAFPWVPAPPTDDLLAARTSVRMEGRTIPVLARNHRLLHLLLHFHDHVGFAKGLLDIAAFVDVHGFACVDEIEELVEALGLTGVMSWPFAALNQLSIVAPAPARRGAAVSLWAGWTANALPGVLRQTESIGARHPASFKLGEITNGEQVAMKAATMALLDRRRDRAVAMLRPITSSPNALARRSGRDAPIAADWLRWALRPADLIRRQLSQMRRDS